MHRKNAPGASRGARSAVDGQSSAAASRTQLPPHPLIEAAFAHTTFAQRSLARALAREERAHLAALRRFLRLGPRPPAAGIHHPG